jgi:hypothetical protein
VLQALHDMVNDLSTFESEEKLYKLNAELEKLSSLLLKEQNDATEKRKKETDPTEAQ